MHKISLQCMDTTKKKVALLLLCIILFVALLPHISFLGNKFIDGDDLVLVAQNPLIRNINLMGLEHDLIGFFKYYYPSFLLTYFWGGIFAIWELNHIGFHFISYLLHTLCSGLLFLILARKTKRLSVPFFSTLVFVLHPLHCEAVNWICRQNVLLSTLFGLIYLILTFLDRPPYRVLRILSILIAVTLSPVSLLFVVAGHLLFSDAQKPLPWVEGGAALAGFFVVWGWKVHTFPFRNLIIWAPSSIFFMAQNLLIPWKIHFMLPALSSVFMPLTLFSFILLLGTGLLYLKTHKDSWGFLFLAFFSVWVFHAGAKRFNGAWTYLSLLWISSALCTGFTGFNLKKRLPKYISLLFLVTIFSSFGALTFVRNKVWAKTETLVNDALQKAPSDSMLLAMYGHYKAAMLNARVMEKAFRNIKHPTPATLCLRAKAYHLALRLRSSSEGFKNLFLKYPDQKRDKYCLFDYAVLELQRGRVQEAKKLFEEIIKYDPYFIYAWHNLGTLLIKEKKEEGIKIFHRVLAIAPAYQPTLENLAFYNMRKNAYDKAVLYLKVALKGTSCHDTQVFYREWIHAMKEKKIFKYAALQWAKLTPPE